MQQGYLLGRLLLRFGGGEAARDIIRNLSATAFDAAGGLWLAADELEDGRVTLSRLQPERPGAYGSRQRFELRDFIDLPAGGADEDEADIEGLDIAGSYLWFTGSHSSKRSKPKGKDRGKDLERLARVSVDANRFVLGRIPLAGGALASSAPDPDQAGQELTAARLADGQGGNLLIEALRADAHLGPFLQTVHGQALLPLAGKENGFDVEGLAVLGRRLFLGLRGPVLRGWASLLEIEPQEAGPGRLGLAILGEQDRRYRKHFLDLDGLGIRELAADGDDLLILAGPTMTLRGQMRVYRLREAASLAADSLTAAGDPRLVPLFDIPTAADGDNAEGFTRYDWAGWPGLLVVYDTPSAERLPVPGEVFADVFRLRE